VQKWLPFLVLATATPFDVKPFRATEPVANDPDDPAIWVNRESPEDSLILATNKVKAPDGALVVYGLDGRIRESMVGIDRPNNVDVEYGLDGIDIAVVTERLKNRLLVFEVNASGLTEIGAIDCCEEPMGIGLYKRPADGAIFAIVAPKGRENSPKSDYLLQFRLVRQEDGRVTGALVRRFGNFSGTKEIEAVVVDDELGFVYYSDEGAGIRKYHANPAHPRAGREIALFAREGYTGDREGLAIYRSEARRGFLIATDQQPGSSVFHVYRREGANRHLFSFRGGSDTTDGIDAASEALGPDFPRGLFVAMNSSGKNFLLYRWEDIMRR
jgi:3-phytase